MWQPDFETEYDLIKSKAEAGFKKSKQKHSQTCSKNRKNRKRK